MEKLTKTVIMMDPESQVFLHFLLKVKVLWYYVRGKYAYLRYVDIVKIRSWSNRDEWKNHTKALTFYGATNSELGFKQLIISKTLVVSVQQKVSARSIIGQKIDPPGRGTERRAMDSKLISVAPSADFHVFRMSIYADAFTVMDMRYLSKIWSRKILAHSLSANSSHHNIKSGDTPTQPLINNNVLILITGQVLAI